MRTRNTTSRFAAESAARTGSSDGLSVSVNDFTLVSTDAIAGDAAQDNRRPTRYSPTFVDGMTGSGLHLRAANGALGSRIPDGEVRIGASGHRSLGWIKPKEVRGFGGSEGDELLNANPSGMHSF